MGLSRLIVHYHWEDAWKLPDPKSTELGISTVAACIDSNIKDLETQDQQPASESKPLATTRLRRWLKRLGVGLLFLILVAAVFHRPLFFEATRYFILRAAKQQNLDVDYTMSGTIFTTLSVLDLRADPLEPGPIKRLEIGEIHLTYSIWDLVRDGLPSFLHELDVRDVYVELEPGEPLPPEKEEEPQAFKFPALIPETLNLANINLLIHAPTGDTVIEGLVFSLLPDEPGVLKVKTVNIPGLRRWTGIHAITTYRDRHLILSELNVGDEIALREFYLDMSEIEESRLRVNLDGVVFDAPISLAASVHDLNASNQTELKLAVDRLVIERIVDYLELDVPVVGEVDHLSLTFDGAPEVPASWNSKLKVRLSGIGYQEFQIGDIQIDATSSGGQLEISLHDQLSKSNSMALYSSATLPNTLDVQLSEIIAQGHLELNLSDLAELTLPVEGKGDLKLTTDFAIKDGELTAESSARSESLSASGAEIVDSQITVTIQKALKTDSDAPWFEAMEVNATAETGRVGFEDYQVDSVRLGIQMDEADVVLSELVVARAENGLRASGSYVLPATGEGWEKQPMTAEFDLSAPTLGDLIAEHGSADLEGALHVKGRAKSINGEIESAIQLEGRDIRASGIPVQSVDGEISITGDEIHVTELVVVLDQNNHINGSGEIQLDEALAYHGTLDVTLDDLSIFQPLLGETPIAGALRLGWSGDGQVSDMSHSGNFHLALTNGSFADVEELSAAVTGDYSPDTINIPDIRAGAGKFGDLALSVFWRDDRLQVSHLAVRQADKVLLSGEIDLPLHLAKWETPDQMVPSDESLSVKLNASDVRVEQVLRQISDEDPPVSATVNLDFTATGTINSLEAQANFRASGIQAAAAEDFDAANVKLAIKLQNDRLTVDGTVEQPLIQPLKISGNLPLNVAEVIRSGEISPNVPLDFRVQLPKSSLAAIPTFVPDIRRSAGTISMDIRVSGTINAPLLAGSVQADLSALRFTDPSLPPVNNFGIQIAFSKDRLVIERGGGDIAGGTFSVGGSIDFSTLDNPVFDLRLGSDKALVVQNDDMTVRVSSDLRVTGPLAAGTVAGDIWITRSRFFRNIDILPIGLPGRPAPQPPEDPPVISFPDPPLRNWKFDIRIRTEDPFLVQSNLATGRIVMDLRLGGTGLRPWLDGSVNIEKLTASLPFSRLEIENGQVYFTQQKPFVPQLNIRGTSTIRDYNVNVNITGTANDPDATFSSNPPLPQAEVVSLLATGMTTKEIGNDPNALAGGAALLVFQRLYNKIFHRDRPPPPRDTFLSRIQFDVGATDPKTGRQSLAVRVPLAEHFMLTGGLDVGGNFRGQVKYLIRFK